MFERTAIALTIASHAAAQALAQATPPVPQIGETHEIRLVRVSSQSGGRSSGSSRSNNGVVERVVGVRDDGLELEYDLPQEAAKRGKSWEYPARVLRLTNGQMQLLDVPAMEARIEAWLKAGGLTRDSCGRWYFTWNAFRVECDPNSVIGTLEVFDLRTPDLRDGSPYRAAGAREPAPLRLKAAGQDGSSYVAELEIDPEQARRKQAELDVVVGEIVKQPITFEEALRRRSTDRFSGTIVVTFDADRSGKLWRRTTAIDQKIEHADGTSETEIATETVERRLAPARTTPP